MIVFTPKFTKVLTKFVANTIGEDETETVSFIDLPPNNLSKLPEKGILKKPCPYGGDTCMKEKWASEGDSQSDNQEIMSQSDNNLGPDMMSGGAMSEVLSFHPW